MNSQLVSVSVGNDNRGGGYRVHVQKGPGVAYPDTHPALLPIEARQVAKELLAAADKADQLNRPLPRRIGNF